MFHYLIMIIRKHLKMNMEDGLAEKLCIVLESCWSQFTSLCLGYYPCINSQKDVAKMTACVSVCGCRKDFTAYADVCFREFGDRVLYWTTINEPNIASIGGFDEGIVPPKRCSPPFGFNCTKGNSTVEPYLAAHHMLLAHASTARLYKKKYQVLFHLWHLCYLRKYMLHLKKNTWSCRENKMDL